MSQEQYLAVYFNYAYTLKNNESTEKCQFQTLYIFFSVYPSVTRVPLAAPHLISPAYKAFTLEPREQQVRDLPSPDPPRGTLYQQASCFWTSPDVCSNPTNTLSGELN